MNRLKAVVFGCVVVGAALAGCGDNSKQCDPGTTMNVDGVCVGKNEVMCTDGTILVDDHCEIDPNSCHDGTVLVGDKCVDPGHVSVDVEEAAEPNGFGLFGELSTDPAGTIALKPVGQHFVIHGAITPFQDTDGDGQTDADIDTYMIDVTGPVMLNISADGLHGLAAGFVGVANVGQGNPLSPWLRFGVNPLGDTSARHIYLPGAGKYLIAIADTRSFLLNGAAPGAQPGHPAFEYYVTVDQVTATPTVLTPTNGVATSSGQLDPGEVKLFSVAMGEGINNAELAVTIDHVQESVVIANASAGTTTIKAVADGDAGDGDPASSTVIGIRSGDSQIVVVDSVFDYANKPYQYDLSITIGSAGALSTNGGDVMQPASDTEFSTFYYDVAADGLVVGMDLAFDRPVSGVVIDDTFSIFSLFTYDPFFGFAFGDTFDGYKGLLKHANEGRYYFLVFDPDGGTADIVATSTYDGLQLMAITKGTPLASQAVNAFASNPYTYAAGTDPWQEFTGSGSGTGVITGTFYRPTAIGRLDPLVNTCGPSCDDSPTPIFAQTYAAAGQTRGRILLDDMTQNYFVKVRTATTAGTPTFDLEFKSRQHTDLGTAVVGTPITQMNQALDATTTVQRYIVRTTAGNGLSIATHPQDLTLDTRIQRLNRDETAAGSLVNNGVAGADDTLQAIQGTTGWTALVVTATAPVVGGQFDVTVNATAPVTYTRAAGTTAFSDACVGGAPIVMNDRDEGAATATIATPAGFDFFGFSAPALRVFSNGFLTFDTALACPTVGSSCFFTNADIPSAANPNALVAPYWDDLVLATAGGACQKVVGTKLIIQWRGIVYNTTTQVLVQAILDGSNDTIEFVYDTTHTATGASATIGIENQVGTAASKVGFNLASSVAPVLFTPM